MSDGVDGEVIRIQGGYREKVEEFLTGKDRWVGVGR